ncbi:p10 [Variegated squirrel bornavirus 1]|uniref:p10 n=1 Tax=Variegated squirrel bornavirus 1 TaxID=1885248 RepID=A0A1D3JBU5_9MONO|nr:p10 [Variegated squirrel bornavirus 1]
MNSDLQLTLLELIRRLNGIAPLESSRVIGGRRESPDITTSQVSITPAKEDSTRCTNTTCGPPSQEHKEEPLHDLRPRTKDRKGTAVE